jgi:hypothetical protein
MSSTIIIFDVEGTADLPSKVNVNTEELTRFRCVPSFVSHEFAIGGNPPHFSLPTVITASVSVDVSHASSSS